MRKVVTSSVFFFVVLTLLARPARAQGAPSAEFAFGYQYMHDNHASLDFPRGWMFSAGGDVVSWFGLVGEIAGSTKDLGSVGGTSVDVSLYTFMGGPKFTVTSRSPVAPFAQILFGAAHGTLSAGSPAASLALSGTNFAVQPGAGVDFNFSPSVGIRGEVDGRTIYGADNTLGQWRVIGAVVFRK